MDERTAAVTAYLAEKTGLSFSADQLEGLGKFLGERMAVLRIQDPAEYVARLADPAEFLEVVDRLTVKETFFYRHEAQFYAFRDRLLPALLESAEAERRRVRLWCAGCCTGEEPYTLAILAAEAGCLDRVEILGTDIHEGYLEAALAGVYSARSVEKLPPPILEKYFSRQGGAFRLCEAIRRSVSFKYLNLGEDHFPSFLNGTAGLDMIFCRNVLIYFDKARVREIVLRFADCLRGDGVLALGHSEMLPREWPLAPEMIGEAFFYRPRGPGAPDAPRPPAPAEARKAPKYRRPPPAPLPAPPPADACGLLLKAGKLADAGRAAEAAALCRKALRADASLEGGHYLLGLLELERPAKAIEHFRRAVYLNAGHLQARLHLAQCEEKLGRAQDAVREYRNLERLAGAKPPEEVYDQGEGITYGMLALIARGALKNLQERKA